MLALSGIATPRHSRVIHIPKDTVSLNNDGDVLTLLDHTGAEVHRIEYGPADVKPGAYVNFQPPRTSKPHPQAYISAILPYPGKKHPTGETLTISSLPVNAKPINVNKWTLTDKAGHVFNINGLIHPGQKKTFVIKGGTIPFDQDEDELTLFDGKGTIVDSVTYSADQIVDGVAIDFDADSSVPAVGKTRIPTVTIVSMLPDPIGKDAGFETLTLKSSGGAVDLSGWKLMDRSDHELVLEGTIEADHQKTFLMKKGTVTLNNKGDEISLYDPDGKLIHAVTYERRDVKEGVIIDFDADDANPNGAVPRIPTVMISSMLPNPLGKDRGSETITLKVYGGTADLSGYKLVDRVGHTFEIDGSVVEDGEEKKFVMKKGTVWLNNKGDTVVLQDKEGRELHRVSYTEEDVLPGVAIDFGKNISDPMAGTSRIPTVQIAAMIPNPIGKDAGHETVTIRVCGGDANVEGYVLIDAAGQKSALSGVMIKDGDEATFELPANGVRLNNNGDVVTLVDAEGNVADRVRYGKGEVMKGSAIEFGTNSENAAWGTARRPVVKISRLLPDPEGRDAGNESISIKTKGGMPDLQRWKIMDSAGHSFELGDAVECEQKFVIKANTVQLNNTGDTIFLYDESGKEVHRVSYSKEHVKEGHSVEFK